MDSKILTSKATGALRKEWGKAWDPYGWRKVETEDKDRVSVSMLLAASNKKAYPKRLQQLKKKKWSLQRSPELCGFRDSSVTQWSFPRLRCYLCAPASLACWGGGIISSTCLSYSREKPFQEAPGQILPHIPLAGIELYVHALTAKVAWKRNSHFSSLHYNGWVESAKKKGEENNG